MQRVAQGESKRYRVEVALIGLTLIASAIHFLDNAHHLDLYPGPAWLTPRIVLLSWLIMPFAALLAYWSNTRIALIAYASLGFAGLGHYLVRTGMQMPLRCTATIGAEALASLALIACFLLRPPATLAARAAARQAPDNRPCKSGK